MADERGCLWCDRPFIQPNVKGPKPLYCSAYHRQLAYVLRRRLREVKGAARTSWLYRIEVRSR